MFLQLGFKSVTMDDIANELGISKKTIYQHYQNKTDLVEAVTYHVFETICSGIEGICTQKYNPIEELFHIKRFVMVNLRNEATSPLFQLKRYYPKLFSGLMCRQREVMMESVKENVQRGMDTGMYRSELDVEFISRMYFNGISGIKDRDIFPEDLFTMDYLTESYLEYHLRAIVTPEGLHKLNQLINEQKLN